VIEHGRDTRAFRPVSVPPAERPRVVAFGALGIAKGATLLQALLELDQREGPAFEFHFLGPLHGTFTPEALGGVVHGDYERDELPDRLAAIAPSFALVTSIWTETYCHTLTEAWMADLPVFASDIGTLRERIARGGGGWLLDHTEPAAFYAGMRRVREQIGEWHLRRAEIARMPARTVDDMAADYRSLYRELLGSPVTLR
jgi:glycosyltransferase involved in cell wall biosynthesis